MRLDVVISVEVDAALPRGANSPWFESLAGAVLAIAPSIEESIGFDATFQGFHALTRVSVIELGADGRPLQPLQLRSDPGE